MHVAIVSTEFVGMTERQSPAYQTRRLVEAADEKGVTTHLVDPSRVYFRLVPGRALHVGYANGPDNLFTTIDAMIVKRTRWLREGMADLVKAVHALDPEIAIFDPPGTYENTTSKVTSLIERETAGVPHPATMIGLGSNFSAREVGIRPPLLHKSITGTQAKGIHRIGSVDALSEELAKARRAEANEDGIAGVLFQEDLDYDIEHRVLVIGGRALGLAERRRTAGTGYTRDQLAEASFHACGPDPEVLSLAERATAAHGYSFSGVDIVSVGGERYVLECNRNPQFERFEAATGLDVAGAMIDHVVEQSTA